MRVRVPPPALFIGLHLPTIFCPTILAQRKILRNSILVVLSTIAAGLVYFVFGQGYWAITGLMLLTVATRFRRKTIDLGKAFQMVLTFLILSVGINELGITYPYSLILILAGLVMVIFFEGPEWKDLYFGPGETGSNFRLSLFVMLALVVLSCSWNYLTFSPEHNPVPVAWPLDALLVIGVGFAAYMAIMEEIIFRSFLLQKLNTAAGEVAAVVGQGFFYGLMHYKVGAPSGIHGIVLASLSGLALGFLVKKSNSIYLAMLVHFVLTLAVFVELAILGKIEGN